MHKSSDDEYHHLKTLSLVLCVKVIEDNMYNFVMGYKRSPSKSEDRDNARSLLSRTSMTRPGYSKGFHIAMLSSHW